MPEENLPYSSDKFAAMPLSEEEKKRREAGKRAVEEKLADLQARVAEREAKEPSESGPNISGPTVQSVARTRITTEPKVEELPPIPEVHLSYSNEKLGVDIDVWVRADLPASYLVDRAQRGLQSAVIPGFGEPDMMAENQYPYESGDFLVIGPEAFTDTDHTVICWKGVNFYRPGETPKPKENT